MKPVEIEFEPNENVVLEIRRHWFFIATEIFFGLIAFLVPLFMYAIFSVLPITITTYGHSIVLFLFFYFIWLLLVWMVMFVFWTDYYLDIWIITNKRIIDIDQRGLFNRNIATAQLSDIEDITSIQGNFLANMMNFGDVMVQTAGSQREFTMKFVNNPDLLRNQLNSLLLKSRNGHHKNSNN
jgi:uncharacterized membrane protein YdbT with pleckstrin-like domain